MNLILRVIVLCYPKREEDKSIATWMEPALFMLVKVIITDLSQYLDLFLRRCQLLLNLDVEL